MNALFRLLAFNFCFVIASFFPVAVAAQIAPKNTNTILVKGVSFDQVVTALLDSGYVIDKIDKEYQTLKTEYRKLCSNCIPELIFDIRVKDSTATISGKWRSNGNFIGGMSTKKDTDNAMIFDIKLEKAKVPKRCFESMNAFALSLKAEISYLERK